MIRMRVRVLAGLVWLLAACGLCAQRVGASLALEGRAAAVRAAMYLIACQHQNGSWFESPGITAWAAAALDGTAEIVPERAVLAESVRHAERWLSRAAGGVSGDRPEGRAAFIGEAKIAGDADAALDAYEARVASGAMPADGMPACDTPAGQLVSALLSGSATPAMVRAGLAAVRRSGFESAGIAAWSRSARAFSACRRAGLLPPEDDWAATLLSTLLDAQRGDGTWVSAEDAGAPARALGTARTLHTLLLTLQE